MDMRLWRRSMTSGAQFGWVFAGKCRSLRESPLESSILPIIVTSLSQEVVNVTYAFIFGRLSSELNFQNPCHTNPIISCMSWHSSQPAVPCHTPSASVCGSGMRVKRLTRWECDTRQSTGSAVGGYRFETFLQKLRTWVAAVETLEYRIVRYECGLIGSRFRYGGWSSGNTTE